MMDEPHLFVAAAVRELVSLGLTYPLCVIRTLDAEDDVPRIDFHITGVPVNVRRQVEDLLLGCLVKCEQDVGFANSIPFVHDSGFNVADLESIAGERLAVFGPSASARG